MRLLLDSANLADVKRFCYSDAVAGVTTNPSLMAKEAVPAVYRDQEPFERYLNMLNDIGDVIFRRDSWHFSVEVVTLDIDQMEDQIRRIRSHLARFEPVVKIPVTEQTLPIITHASKHLDIRVNATACMTAMQAKLASDAGASFVSFFYNRMIDHGVSAGAVLNGREICPDDARDDAQREILRYSAWKSQGRVTAESICGSIRRADDVLECWAAQADYVTASAKVISEILTHPATTASIEKFQKDIDAWLGSK